MPSRTSTPSRLTRVADRSRKLDRFTVGVEEEYQLVDPVTGELRAGAQGVRGTDRTGEVAGEIQESMLEVGTPPARNLAEVETALRERRFQASSAAAAEDLEIFAAGIHPFSPWQQQSLSREQRPRQLLRVFGQLLRQQNISGMHIHVGIPEDLDRAHIMNVVRGYTPHLLALSCSSPFSLGNDTGFCSFRAVIWRGFPFTGAPPFFASDDEYRAFVQLLQRGGMIMDERTLYWSVRPSARYRTLEIRICDTCPRLHDAVAIAALARSLVIAAAHHDLEAIGSSLAPSLQENLLGANEWVAARDGLQAEITVPEAGTDRVALRPAIDELLERLRPIAAELGDEEALQGVGTILERGNGADEMRKQRAAGADPRDVVAWLVDETRAGTGIDRRKQSRTPVPVPAGGGK